MGRIRHARRLVQEDGSTAGSVIRRLELERESQCGDACCVGLLQAYEEKEPDIRRDWKCRSCASRGIMALHSMGVFEQWLNMGQSAEDSWPHAVKIAKEANATASTQIPAERLHAGGLACRLLGLWTLEKVPPLETFLRVELADTPLASIGREAVLEGDKPLVRNSCPCANLRRHGFPRLQRVHAPVVVPVYSRRPGTDSVLQSPHRTAETGLHQHASFGHVRRGSAPFGSRVRGQPRQRRIRMSTQSGRRSG